MDFEFDTSFGLLLDVFFEWYHFDYLLLPEISANLNN
jgi:hypothetical protein